jgi:hypothetical protein
MKTACIRLAILALLAVTFTGFYGTEAAEPKGKDLASFGVLPAPSLESVRGQAQEWLKSAGKTDQASTQAFGAIWSQTDRPLLDLVADTFALGNPDVKKLLDEARDPNAPAPKQVPDLVKDLKLPVFFRANLALAYAKALASRRVYEEALDALKGVRVEQVVDPAAYFFHKAVAEHGMLIKPDATRSIARLLDDVPDAPERYKMVAALMYLDMQTWKEKDLGDIGRKMNNIERRLDLARGGPHTQKLQKEVVMRLDEIIKKLENQQKGGGGGGGGGQNPGCPPGGQPSGGAPSAGAPTAPQTDSIGGTNSGPGNVDPKKIKDIIEAWGKLPEKERAKAMTDMIRGMPPAYRQMIEEFYKRGAAGNSDGK